MDSVRRIPAIALLLTAPAGAIDIDAIYTNLAGHPTAQVPGVPGEQFRTPLVPFLALYGSPNGANWIFKAFTDNPDGKTTILAILDRHFAVRLERIRGESTGFAAMLRNRCTVQRFRREQVRKVPVQDRHTENQEQMPGMGPRTRRARQPHRRRVRARSHLAAAMRPTSPSATTCNPANWASAWPQ